MKVRLLLLTSLLICAFGCFVDAQEGHINDKDVAGKISFPTHRPCELVERPDPILLNTHSIMLEKMEDSEVTVTIIVKESLGWHFITAYCPAECGWNGDNYPAGWMTASGEICHRADWDHRYSEPTTCAIDRSIYPFYEYFYIEEFDRVFVSEDTGLFSGYWLDLFYEDYEDVLSFPTGYYEVYAVEFEETTVHLGG